MPSTSVLFCCDNDWEQIVADELNRVFPNGAARPIADGWVEVDGSPVATSMTPAVALAAQCLPDARQIEAESIAEWVRAGGLRIIETLREHTGPWRLHIVGNYSPEGTIPRRRARLIELGIIELLRKRQRRLVRSLSSSDVPFAAGESFAQIALVTPTSGYSSVVVPDALRHWRRCLSPFPAGRIEVPQDRHAPSRAFAKLVEAELRMGCRITTGDTVVDLGASPGSWSYVALGRGAEVTAVDRSPLRADLMKHPRLKFVRGDAFAFVPPAPVEWLLCDVVAFPDRILALVDRWLSERWCRRFCVTIKFRGHGEFAVLEEFKRMLEASGAEYLLRRLTSNKNEVTAFGARD